MTNFIYARPDKFDISITFTIYSSRKQTTQTRFKLRNLRGNSEVKQLKVARSILNELAEELYAITQFGVDKGTIHLDGKKASEVLYPNYTPAEEAIFFFHGVVIKFTASRYHAFSLANRHNWRMFADAASDGWKRTIQTTPKPISFRLPCQPTNQFEPDTVFRYIAPMRRRKGSKQKKWVADYAREHVLLRRFLDRFYEDGNLCLGEKYAWAAEVAQPQIEGIHWPLPKVNSKKVPTKSTLASQPTDNTDYVYLIRLGRTKKYKIGKSNDPAARLASLQTASPFKLKLLHAFPADNASNAEESLHIALIKQRLEGEWFRLSDKQKAAIEAVKAFKDGRFHFTTQTLTATELVEEAIRS